MQDGHSSRRSFLSRIAGAGMMAGFPSLGVATGTGASIAGLPVVYFSKHLQWLDWEPMAETAKKLGFDGLDITVRGGGHVEPERVRQDLPKVAKIVRAAGLELPMITTEIVDANSPHAEEIIRTASELGIPRYRWGGFAWSDDPHAPNVSNIHGFNQRRRGLLLNVPARLEELKKRTAALADLNEKYKACAMYHNHSGPLVGASVWDLWVVIKDLDSRWVSSNFDIAHATVEGGLGGWVNSARLMTPFMRGTAVKDFKWGQNSKGEWEPLWCPLGQGMVNFPAYLAMIREAEFSGPVQLHTEYSLGGAEEGSRTPTMGKSQILDFIRRDLNTLRAWMKQAQFS